MVTFYRRLPKFGYLVPETVDEALSWLAQYKGRARILAGGTDIIPKLKRREMKAPECIIDLKGLTDSDYIRYDDNGGLTLGPLVTIHAIETSSIIREKYNILSQAAEGMASPQVRNRGTLAGNICNAVPSADMAPALLTLGAELKLVSLKGVRMVNIEQFFTGPNQTTLTGEEILLEIQLPSLPESARGIYLKLSPRRAMDLAIVGVAVVAVPRETGHETRIALGAVAPTPIRAKLAEGLLSGKNIDDKAIEEASLAAAEESRPIDDHRASAEYRKEMVKVLCKRALKQVLS